MLSRPVDNKMQQLHLILSLNPYTIRKQIRCSTSLQHHLQEETTLTLEVNTLYLKESIC